MSEQADNHAALNAAIDEMARTTVLSRDQATTIAMNYPYPDFLRFYAANHGQLSRYGLTNAWSVYANPAATRIDADAAG